MAWSSLEALLSCNLCLHFHDWDHLPRGLEWLQRSDERPVLIQTHYSLVSLLLKITKIPLGFKLLKFSRNGYMKMGPKMPDYRGAFMGRVDPIINPKFRPTASLESIISFGDNYVRPGLETYIYRSTPRVKKPSPFPSTIRAMIGSGLGCLAYEKSIPENLYPIQQK